MAARVLGSERYLCAGVDGAISAEPTQSPTETRRASGQAGCPKTATFRRYGAATYLTICTEAPTGQGQKAAAAPTKRGCKTTEAATTTR